MCPKEKGEKEEEVLTFRNTDTTAATSATQDGNIGFRIPPIVQVPALPNPIGIFRGASLKILLMPIGENAMRDGGQGPR